MFAKLNSEPSVSEKSVNAIFASYAEPSAFAPAVAEYPTAEPAQCVP